MLLGSVIYADKYLGEKEDAEHSATHHESNVEMDELLADDDNVHFTRPSRAHCSLSWKPLHSHVTAQEFPNASQEPISRLILQLDFDDQTTVKALHQAFYSSRVFQAALWLLNIIIAAMGSWEMSHWLLKADTHTNGDIWTGVIVFVAFISPIVWIVAAASIPWSRLYR